MKIIGVDLHTRQQTIAMLDDQTGELVERELSHEGQQVRDFYEALPKPVLVGVEATGSMHWFFATTGGTRHRVPCRSSGTDPGRRATQAEERSA